MLLDGPRIRAGRAGVSERPRWFAREDFNKWPGALDRTITSNKSRQALSRLSLCKGEGRVMVLFPASHASKDPSPQSSPLQKGERRIQRFAETSLSAVLLAGGESRRMGSDKASLLFRGVPLWQNQLETLRKLQPTEIFVSARRDPTWRPADVDFVPDDPPSRGPLSGLAASAAQMHTAHLLALAVDMPFMSESYLRHLCDQIEPGRGVLPKIGTRAEPLAAIYPREAAIDLHHALTGTNFSLQSLARDLVATGKLQELSVAEPDKKFFLNVNVPSEFPSV